MLNWINNHQIKMSEVVINFGSNIRSKDTKTIYYVITFLSTFAASTSYATYVLFLLSQGLDLLQVNLVNLAFMTGNFLFEVPTGAYADYFGRRKSVMLGNAFVALALGTYFFSSTIAMFILAETIAALAFTFESGALDAWLVDSLKEKGYVGKVDFIFSHAGVIGQVGSLLGGLSGAYIGALNLRLPLGFGALIAIFTLIVTGIFMQEKLKEHKRLSIKQGFFQIGRIAREGITYGVSHKVILWLVISSMLALFALQPLNMYWSPRLNSLAGNQIWLMGWVWVGISLFMMSGNFLIRYLLKLEKSYLWILIAMVLIMGVPIILAALSNIFLIVLSGFLVYEIGRGMMNPVYKGYLNRYIPDEHRATILSFNSMMGKFGAAGGLVALGFVAKYYSIQTAWLIAGVLLLFLIPIYLRVTKHANQIGTVS